VLSSYCQTCGASKEPANYADNYCPACTSLRREAEQAFAAENPEASESDILYAGRQALSQRAHHANRNFTDPRAFSSGRGSFPAPPVNNRGVA